MPEGLPVPACVLGERSVYKICCRWEVALPAIDQYLAQYDQEHRGAWSGSGYRLFWPVLVGPLWISKEVKDALWGTPHNTPAAR